ncbi:hypothetical protein GTW98_30415 [Streptomyces sp. SID8375]|nr:hypothetical protein [Streptomyces sp. SID8375]
MDGQIFVGQPGGEAGKQLVQQLRVRGGRPGGAGRGAHLAGVRRVIAAEHLGGLGEIALQPPQRGMTRVNPVRTSRRATPRVSRVRSASVVAAAAFARRPGRPRKRSPLVSRARSEVGR